MTSSRSAGTVAVLGSGFGLGFYVPSLAIRDQLRGLGVSARTVIFEALLPPDKLTMVDRNRRAYHDSFAVALASQKVPTDIRASIDEEAKQRLFLEWDALRCDQFICISGHWVHVLDEYRRTRPAKHLKVDLLYLDVELSPSWKWLRKINPAYAEGYTEIRVYDANRMTMNWAVGAAIQPPMSISERQSTLVVHGGGWGIGTYRERTESLESAGYNLAIACYGDQEVQAGTPTRRYYMDDPGWRAWHTNSAGDHTYPRFAELKGDGSTEFGQPHGQHGLYSVIASSLGIVTKAGAGSLIDSFRAATPLILLDPFGPHEARNADLWVAAGFGIRMEDWARAGFSRDVLENLHRALVRHRSRVPDYVDAYVARRAGEVAPA